MIGHELELSLHMAFLEAHRKRHRYVTAEHLLLALLDNPAVKGVLNACAADIEKLRRSLTDFIDAHTPSVPGAEEFDSQLNSRSQRVIQRAILQAQSSGRTEVTGDAVLVALLGERDSRAVDLLREQGLSTPELIDCIARGSAGAPQAGSSEGRPAPDAREREAEAEGEFEAYVTNLNAQALAGSIDPLLGREQEIERVIRTLCRRRKNNPLLVGEAGVGKTAIAEGLACRIVASRVPEELARCRVYALDMGALLAGTKYRGDFEQRLETVLAEFTRNPDAILFIDEIHTLIGAGATSGGNLSAANLLKPALASGSLRCIGATTSDEYRSVFDRDKALSRRFQRIEVPEPSVEETVAILRGLKSRFETHHGVKYSAPALARAAELAARHINDRRLPDKAIDVIDEAGAAQRARPGSKRKKLIGTAEIEAIVARMARIPCASLSRTERDALRDLERDLKALVFGQDEAIGALAAAVRTARSGLGSEGKPIGCFLFSGPTGVGKTEVANQLGACLGIELHRFDMSEYMERHAVSRLIGAPPGYVGFEQGGLLTEAIGRSPHSVLLLDEIEKAHPDIFNILLQVMDHGTLTDNTGRKADFRNVVVVMTTNAGAESLDRPVLGFTAGKAPGDEMAEIKRLFPPEFRNRLDAIVAFRSLDRDAILRVVDKFLAELAGQLRAKGVAPIFTDALRGYLAERGFDPLMGARPMSRLIRDTVKKALAEELLFGALAQGGTVTVDVDAQGKIKLRCEETAEACR
ncbi:MAG: AAA family ATPase [Betaproteobacteria bacterium]|nr:AAA family ATPase [Betaproteobacteria bacterium]